MQRGAKVLKSNSLRNVADSLRKLASKKIPKNWKEYEHEVQKLEDEGLTTSDAQGEVDARLMSEGYDPVTLKKKAAKKSVTFSPSLHSALQREIESQAADLGDSLSGVEEVVGSGLSGDVKKEWLQLIETHGFKSVTKAVKKEFHL